jgi:FkbM family methyltransferase
MTSYSQIGQDLAVLNYYNNKQNGYFVEVGASDGITLSNTYLLEKDFDWKGICVEANPTKFKQLCKNRPTALCVEDAVFSQSGLTVKFEVHYLDLCSGISGYTTTRKKKWATDFKNSSHEIFVTTISLTDLLSNANAPAFIEYLSLDTEGSEFEILKTHDFSKYKFGLIDVEHNFIEPRRTQIRNLLESNGYEFIGQNYFDDCYKLIVTS